MQIPAHLVILNGALAMDGGSVYLEAVDDQTSERRIRLDWSIKATRSKNTCLFIDEFPVPKGSELERQWVALIATAEIRSKNEPRSEVPQISNKRIVLAQDAAALLNAASSGPNQALAVLRDGMWEKLNSPTHQSTQA